MCFGMLSIPQKLLMPSLLGGLSAVRPLIVTQSMFNKWLSSDLKYFYSVSLFYLSCMFKVQFAIWHLYMLVLYVELLCSGNHFLLYIV